MHCKIWSHRALASLLLPLAAQTSLTYAETRVLEEIVVVARKREEPAQDVPISLTLIDASKIENLTVTRLNQLIGNIPNAALDITGNSFSSWGMRGIVSQTRNPGQESGLGVYVDRVYLGRPGGFNVPLNDIEQIEVLRGPQGSLYGRNTIAGAININTRRPTDEVSGYFQASLGNYSRQDLQAGISGPLVGDQLAGKINLFSFRHDGYVDNLYSGADLQSDDRVGGAATLYWTPSDALEIKLAADYMEQDNNFLGGASIEPQLNNFIPGWYFKDDHTVNQNDPGSDDIETGGYSLSVDWELDSALTLTSITSARVTDLETLNDDDAGPITLSWSHFDDDADTFSQEFMLTGDAGERISYVAGLYFLDMDISSHRVTGLSGPYPDGRAAITSNSEVDTRSNAAYGSVTLGVTETLDFTLGVRYTDEEKSSTFTQSENGGLGFPNVTFDEDINDDDLSGDISLTWFATESTNFYGSVRKGFKSGGFQTDIITFSSPDLFTFGPEEALSYELGLKGVYLENRLTVDLSVFHTDYSDMQVGQLVGLGFTTRNAAESEIDGMELQVSYRPTDALRLGFGLGLLDDEYTDFDDCAGFGTSCTGNKLQYAPDSNWSADIGYTLPLTGGAEIDFFLSANYRDSYFLTAVNDPQLEIDERTLLDARIAYSTADDALTIALWGRNLGDENWDLTRWQYPVTAQVFGALDPTITGAQKTPAEPKTYGVEITFRF